MSDPITMSDSEIKMSDSEIEKHLVGKWLCREEFNQGWRWSYTSEFTADGRCTNAGTGERGGETIEFRNSGRYWVKDQKLCYAIEESSIPMLVGRETVDPLLALSANETVWRNTQGGKVFLCRVN